MAIKTRFAKHFTKSINLLGSLSKSNSGLPQLCFVIVPVKHIQTFVSNDTHIRMIFSA